MPTLGNRRAVIRQNISPNRQAPRGVGLGNARPAPPKGGGAGQQPAAPGPTAPQQSPQGPMPWDVAAANSEAAAGKRLSNTLMGLQAGWLGQQQEFGLEGPWADAASNPYSRAALLQRSYDGAKRGSLNSAGRQLYAGSYVNAQNHNTHNFNLGRDELQKAYAQVRAQNLREQQEAQDRFNEEVAEAGWNRVNAGLESEPEPMPGGGGGEGGGGGGGGRRHQIKRNIGISQRRRAR